MESFPPYFQIALLWSSDSGLLFILHRYSSSGAVILILLFSSFFKARPEWSSFSCIAVSKFPMMTKRCSQCRKKAGTLRQAQDKLRAEIAAQIKIEPILILYFPSFFKILLDLNFHLFIDFIENQQATGQEERNRRKNTDQHFGACSHRLRLNYILGSF